jgi:hypothetical protein
MVFLSSGAKSLKFDPAFLDFYIDPHIDLLIDSQFIDFQVINSQLIGSSTLGLLGNLQRGSLRIFGDSAANLKLGDIL